MRLLLPALALVPLGLATAAHATVYDFSFSGADGETNQSFDETFRIDTSNLFVAPPNDPGFTCTGANCFTYQATDADASHDSNNSGSYFVVNRNGVISELPDIFQNPIEEISLYSDYGGTMPVNLFSGSSSNPSIVQGTFYAYIYFPNESFSPYGTLTIVDPPGASAVPEPSTLALLGTGILSAAGIMRRRLL